VVRAAVGFSEFNGRNLATTGVLVQARSPAPGGPPEVVPLTFAFDPNIDSLRADFLVPTNFVRIDMACGDDDLGEMRAFDASDNLLATSNRVTCDRRRANANGTAVISRSMADIAYITAAGILRVRARLRAPQAAPRSRFASTSRPGEAVMHDPQVNEGGEHDRRHRRAGGGPAEKADARAQADVARAVR
jgi:hypothetical protein